MTELLYHSDSYLREFDARPSRPTGSAWRWTAPHSMPRAEGNRTTQGRSALARREGQLVWYTFQGADMPAVGERLSGRLDWDRRYKPRR